MNVPSKELGSKLSKPDIQAFENQFDLKLLASLADFYLKWNGGTLKAKFKYTGADLNSGVYPILEILPLDKPFDSDADSVSSILAWFRKINPSFAAYLPIAFDLFDNLIAASLKDGKIYWIDHEEPNHLIYFGNDIFSFLDSLVEESPEERETEIARGQYENK